jgi:uncharacterized protein (TIGR00303 family)
VIDFVTAPERGRAMAARWRGERPTYICVLAHTDTCLLPGISSAGVSEQLRPLTPAADAEVVALGRPLCLPMLPSNPAGAPGPAGITRAALRLAGIQTRFVGAGLRVWPSVACTRVSEQPGLDIACARAVPNAAGLFERGLALGRDLARQAPYTVLAESVPGGTTTALAVLLALGYAADGRVSGSMPGNAHALKSQVAHAALRAAGITSAVDGLTAVTRVGDPMQPLAAGIAVGITSNGGDVLLAGGSQMIGVAALVAELAGTETLDRLAVGTTRWVVNDPESDVAGLTREVSHLLPLLAVPLDFSGSRHAGLRQYESFVVKEGVGAGGACVAALLATGATLDELVAQIETVYDGLLGRLTTRDSADSRRR